MHNRIALPAVLAALFALGMPARAQQASGPPIPITPPAAVYAEKPPSPPPPGAAMPRATARTQTPQAFTPQASATTAAAIATRPAAGLDCGAQLVVWANTASRIYLFSTSDYYGHTKVGSYMCESDAKAQGMRPGRTEVRP